MIGKVQTIFFFAQLIARAKKKDLKGLLRRRAERSGNMLSGNIYI